MSARGDRRGWRVAAALVAATGLGMAAASVVGAGAAAQTGPAGPAETAGRQLYLTGCSSCHGTDGQGTDRGPSLVGVGAASADFYLSTGRMPLDEPRAQALRKRPAYTRAEIDQLVAYVASLGPGPEIPKVDPATGHLPTGNELFANNCAACHSSAGAGGALGHAIIAPNLQKATPTQVAEAVRIGPGRMPVFGPDALDEHQLASVVRYVEYLQHPRDEGGLGLGHLGPLPEGFVAWLVGLGLMLIAIRWIGTTD
ncbi:MAG TPA: c-type cytochrome [Acidimicrobiales bacterium]|nr:c-type cytochrome [Acidimicrobiales bacterium]